MSVGVRHPVPPVVSDTLRVREGSSCVVVEEVFIDPRVLPFTFPEPSVAPLLSHLPRVP